MQADCQTSVKKTVVGGTNFSFEVVCHGVSCEHGNPSDCKPKGTGALRYCECMDGGADGVISPCLTVLSVGQTGVAVRCIRRDNCSTACNRIESIAGTEPPTSIFTCECLP